MLRFHFLRSKFAHYHLVSSYSGRNFSLFFRSVLISILFFLYISFFSRTFQHLTFPKSSAMSISRVNLRRGLKGKLQFLTFGNSGVRQQACFSYNNPLFLKRTGGKLTPSLSRRSFKQISSAYSKPGNVHAPLANGNSPSLQDLHEIKSATHPAFEIIEQEQVEELQLNATFYNHKATSAKILSFSVPSTEEEKVFTIGFRTPSIDSTGVAHILEHSVLCGSSNFPVKEPFVELLKGSMYTFLNAMTYPDFTCYPCASVNNKDFYNIARVYLDAVLNPRAAKDPDVFYQEGCRIGLREERALETPANSIVEDANGAVASSLETDAESVPAITPSSTVRSFPAELQSNRLAFKGVVYNEMKSVYSSADALMVRIIHQSLHPDNSYRFDSGGDPEFISSLNFEKFKDYYGKYYHPSNSLLLFWGSDDVFNRLQFADSFLKEIKLPQTPSVPSMVSTQKSLNKPQWISHPGPGTMENLEDMVTVNWVLDPETGITTTGKDTCNLSTEEKFNLMILNWLLLGTSASKLHRALMDSGFGTQVIGGGLSVEQKHAQFSVGLKGITPSKVTPKKIEAIVLDTLKDCATNGFSEEAVNAALNSCEFELREFNTGMLPKGLLIILRSLSEWVSGRPPVDIWRFEKPFEILRKRLSKGEPVFENLIKTYFLENTHRVSIHLEADGDYVLKKDALESEKLQKIESTMNETDFSALKEKEFLLQQKQMAEDSLENLNTLPSLEIEDLDKQTAEIPTETSSVSNVTVFTHRLPTAGILYVDLFFDLKDLPASELPLLTLYGDLIREAGTSALSETDLIHSIGAHTGGLSAGVSIHNQYEGVGRITDPSKILGFFGIHGKAMKHKTQNLLYLMRNILTDARLDNAKRAIELLKEHLSAQEAHIVQAGDRFGVKHILSEFTAANYAAERMSGFSLVASLRDLIKEAETNWPVVEMRLKNLQNTFIQKARMLINLTGDKATLDNVLSNASDSLKQDLLDGIPDVSKGPVLIPTPSFGWQHPSEEQSRNWAVTTPVEGFCVPTQVNFVSLGGRLYSPGERCNAGASTVISQALTTGYLWDTIRVVGGAYGVRFYSDPLSGCYCFSSHRDPSIEKTLFSYRNAPFAIHQMAKHIASSPKTLTRSIIGAMRDVDRPLHVDRKGQKAFWQAAQGETREDRQQYREQILKITANDFKEFAERLDESLNGKKLPQIAAIVASQERLQAFVDSNKFSSAFRLKNVFAETDPVGKSH